MLLNRIALAYRDLNLHLEAKTGVDGIYLDTVSRMCSWGVRGRNSFVVTVVHSREIWFLATFRGDQSPASHDRAFEGLGFEPWKRAAVRWVENIRQG